MKSKILALLAAGSFASPLTANAIPIQHTYDFYASGFSPAGGPADSVDGRVTATFDEAAVGGGLVDAIDLTIGGYSFSAAEVGFNQFGSGIIFGGLSGGTNTMFGDTNDFWLYFNFDFSSPGFAYSNSPVDPDGYFFYAGTTTPSAASVPEPATLALFGIGLLGIGAARRKSAAQVK